MHIYTNKASNDAKGIWSVHKYVQNNDTCKEYYNKEVCEHFELFEKKAQIDFLKIFMM